MPFDSGYREQPFWWEAFDPRGYPERELPRETGVAIIGAGYTGLSAALELAKRGIACCLLDSGDPGFHASTRSGGIVAGPGGVKSPLVNAQPDAGEQLRRVRAAADAVKLLEDLIATHGISCEWQSTGCIKLANTRGHYRGLEAKTATLTDLDEVHGNLIHGDDMRDHIGSDAFPGGLLTHPGGHLHPGRFFAGLLAASERCDSIRICGHASVHRIDPQGAGWRIETARGGMRAAHVLVATNGYTGSVTPALRRRLLPISGYVIATEVLDDALAREISPRNHGFVESTRISPYFRLSGEPGGQRMIFGSRVRWVDISATEMAPLLYRQMLARFPQLAGVRITHAWNGNVALTLDESYHNGQLSGLHYALGCNGSGVANMTWLGAQAARQIAGSDDYSSPFDGEFPDSRFYDGSRRWFVPLIGNYLQMRDWLDRKLDR